MGQNWWDADETVWAPPPPKGKAVSDWWANDENVEDPKPRKNGKPSKRTDAPANSVTAPTGNVRDGDTFRMQGGGNARLSGVDAFELDQTGRTRSGTVPLGLNARNFLQSNISPDSTVTGTGAQTYGRPVVTLNTDGQDVGREIIYTGNGLATPEYLKNDPRLTDYLETERLARLNRRGAHAGQFQSPEDFRDGKPDPWAKAEAGEYGNSIAVFPDEPTPFQGLRPEIEEGYVALAKDPKSTATDLTAYAKANGFHIDPKVADKFIKDRVSHAVADGVTYGELPQVLTDPGDGTIGATVRGLSDPMNVLDEMGGVIDTLGGTGGRENIWTSDRRFGDILYNNIDQNRSILDFDDANHPYARFGGQLASGLVLPSASVEGVGLAAARKVLQEGGSRFAAEAAAKAAIRSRAGVAGSVEGGLAGFGAGEGDPIDRLPSAAVGAVTGYGLGYGAAALTDTLAPAGKKLLSGRLGPVVDDGAGASVAPSRETESPWDLDEVVEDATAIVPMAREDPAPSISSERVADRIDVTDRPRPLLSEPTSAERVAQANRIEPRDVVPAASEEWGDAPDLAGNIRIDKLDTPQDITRAISTTERLTGGFDAARRGRIRQAETEQLASELGMTADDLLQRRNGQAFNAEQALAARQILAKSGNELVNMARRIQRMDDPGEEALAGFRQAWVRHAAIQEQIAGATAEAGRALAQFRMLADGRRVHGKILNALSEGGGGKDKLKQVADILIENSDNPADLNKTAAKLLKPKLLDKINEYWINSLLSGPQTHVVNVVGNTMTALAQLPEHAIAAGIGAGRQAAVKRQVDRVLFSEVGARSVGLLQGAKEGLAQAARTLRTGQESDFAGKVEARTQEAIGGIAGKIIRTPTRLLSAEDELFKGIARRMELNGLAVRKAAQEGLKGDAAKDRVAELVANPTDEMMDRAFDYGRYVTFQRQLGPAAQSISAFTQKMPGMKFVLPFVRTPTNLLKFSLERSPAAPLIDTWRADFRRGGASRDLAVARIMVGTGVGAMVAELASQGLITGNGPADPAVKQEMLANGWQPYSFKIGGKYVSYARLDPFASTLGVAAGLVDLQDHMTEKQQDNVASLLTASVLQNLASKTWLSGIGDLVEAINDPARYSDSWIKRMAASAAVPAGVAQVARTNDPVLREAETVMDAIRARVPGQSQKLEPRRDVLGRTITNEGGVGPNIISPIWQSTDKKDPVLNALIETGMHISKPNREVAGVRLKAAEWSRYQELVGQRAYPDLQALIADPDWKALPRDEKQDDVSDAMKAARKEAKKTLFTSSPARL